MRKIVLLFLLSLVVLCTTGQSSISKMQIAITNSYYSINTIYGSELISNGTFNSNTTGWSIAGTSWAWQTDGAGGGWLRHTASAEDEMTYQTILTVGVTYHVEITLAGSTAGYVNIYCGNTWENGHTIVDVGVYIFDLTCSGNTNMYFEATTTFNGYIDSISVKEVL